MFGGILKGNLQQDLGDCPEFINGHLAHPLGEFQVRAVYRPADELLEVRGKFREILERHLLADPASDRAAVILEILDRLV